MRQDDPDQEAGRLPGLYGRGRGRLSGGPGGSCDSGQSVDPQVKRGVVEASSQCDLSLYADLRLLAQPGGDLVRDPEPQSPDGSELPEPGELDYGSSELHVGHQSKRGSVRLEEKGGQGCPAQKYNY